MKTKSEHEKAMTRKVIAHEAACFEVQRVPEVRKKFVVKLVRLPILTPLIVSVRFCGITQAGFTIQLQPLKFAAQCFLSRVQTTTKFDKHPVVNF